MKRAGKVDRLENVDHVARPDAQRIQPRHDLGQRGFPGDLGKADSRLLGDL